MQVCKNVHYGKTSVRCDNANTAVRVCCSCGHIKCRWMLGWCADRWLCTYLLLVGSSTSLGSWQTLRNLVARLPPPRQADRQIILSQGKQRNLFCRAGMEWNSLGIFSLSQALQSCLSFCHKKKKC